MKNEHTFVDLFCGAGGMSLGFQNAGFENIFSIDYEKPYCETYRYNFPNHKVLEKDIVTLSEQEIQDLVGGQQVTVVVGGPPCQGFSMAGKIGRRFLDDERNHLFKEFARVINIIKPLFFVMENVARVYTHNQGKTKQEMLDTFLRMGYHVKCAVLNTKDYDVPQSRSRIIFIGSLLPIDITFPPRSLQKSKSVSQAIGHLPKLVSGQTSNVPNHSAMHHGSEMLEKMQYVKDGGNREDIPLALRPTSGDVRKYIRYKSDDVSVCITGDMRKVFHYDQNRALTVRELAAIQTFPDDFVFCGKSIAQQQQVGNSVPPIFAEKIAKHIKKIIDSY
jgi:DNA (cytosine-5)-methyltransferase 1